MMNWPPCGLLGGLFLLLLDLGVVFVGFFLLLLGLAAQALGFFLRLLHLLPLLIELGQDILEVHVVLTDQAPRLLQDAVVQPPGAWRWQTRWTCRARR